LSQLTVGIFAKVFRLSQLVETISRKPIPAHQKNVILEVTAEDTTEEDVEIPYVMVKIK
jgi:ubiquitin-activating enzyme E1